MEKLTENEKYHALLCVKYVRHELSTKLLKFGSEYGSQGQQDANREQSIEQIRESIALHETLINKLEKIL